MSFTRSNDGLSNEAIFRNADYIVYIEGCERTKEHRLSFDELFWTSVFRAIKPSTRIVFKPLGSKKNLLPICEKISSGLVTKTLVCLDSDYDHLSKMSLSNNNILYTYGYSWENDIISERGFREVVSVWSTSRSLYDTLHSYYREFIRRIRHIGDIVGPVDVRAQQTGSPIQSKSNIEELIDLQPPNIGLSRRKIISKIKQIKLQKKFPIRQVSTPYNSIRNFHGKVILHLIYRGAWNASEARGRCSGLNKNIFINIMMRERFAVDINNWGEMGNYYTKILSQIDLPASVHPADAEVDDVQ